MVSVLLTATMKGESEQNVLSGLAILGNTNLEFTSTSGNSEDSAISLGGTRDHVPDEITVSRSINDPDYPLLRC